MLRDTISQISSQKRIRGATYSCLKHREKSSERQRSPLQCANMFGGVALVYKSGWEVIYARGSSPVQFNRAGCISALRVQSSVAGAREQSVALASVKRESGVVCCGPRVVVQVW